jgi:uncharacterized protein (DUF1684 family)
MPPSSAVAIRFIWHSWLVHVVRVLTAAALIVSGGCSSAPEDYAGKIARHRAEKNEFLEQSADIVLPKDRDKFLPLSYFPIDEGYAVPAQLQQTPQRLRMQVPTSTGTLRDMERVGSLQFTLKGQPLKLSALVEAGTTKVERLSVMFSDLTSGTETYTAGRYLELDPTPTGIYIIDFNDAFHPYCYYNPAYECPYPPPENRLQLPVRAGEKLRAADTMVPR